jgi:hypothetical protein
MKLRSGKENAYAGGHPHIKLSGAQNIQASLSPKTLLHQETEIKSNANAPLIVRNRMTSLTDLVSRLAKDNGGSGAWIVVIGYEGIDGNFRGNSTTSDTIMAEGCSRESEKADATSIFEWNSKTEFISHCP